MLSKSLQPLPDKWHGLGDRRRYRQIFGLDCESPIKKKTFRTRALLVSSIRRY